MIETVFIKALISIMEPYSLLLKWGLFLGGWITQQAAFAPVSLCIFRADLMNTQLTNYSPGRTMPGILIPAAIMGQADNIGRRATNCDRNEEYGAFQVLFFSPHAPKNTLAPKSLTLFILVKNVFKWQWSICCVKSPSCLSSFSSGSVLNHSRYAELSGISKQVQGKTGMSRFSKRHGCSFPSELGSFLKQYILGE